MFCISGCRCAARAETGVSANSCPGEIAETGMVRFNGLWFAVLFLSLAALCGCQDLVPHDTTSLLTPRFHRSEIFGFVAGRATTLAAVPDLVAMLRRRSSAGMNPRMAAITGVFQVLWIYYGLLIASLPVIAWNVIAMLINFWSVSAYLYFVRNENATETLRSTCVASREERGDGRQVP